jgi:hypothetical protein
MITLQLARKADEYSAKTEVFSLAINKTSGGLYYNRPFDSGPLMTAVVNAHSRLIVDCEELFVGGFFLVHLLRQKGFFRARVSKTGITLTSLSPAAVFFARWTCS